METIITHDEENKKFVTTIDGYEAVLEYKIADEKTINFYRTYVPGELRGRGIAGKLTNKGIEYAMEKGLKVIPGCSYVASFFKKNQQFNSLLG